MQLHLWLYPLHDARSAPSPPLASYSFSRRPELEQCVQNQVSAEGKRERILIPPMCVCTSRAKKMADVISVKTGVWRLFLGHVRFVKFGGPKHHKRFSKEILALYVFVVESTIPWPLSWGRYSKDYTLCQGDYPLLSVAPFSYYPLD